MQKQGVLFDFDGVTVKSMEQHYEGWRMAFAEKGIELKKEDFLPLEGQGIDEISRAIGRRYGMDDEIISEIVKRKVYYYNELMTVEFYEHYLEMLRNLKEKDIKTGVVTGGSRERVEPIIDEYFSDFFKVVVTVADVKRGKPHADPYLKGADLLGLSPEACIAVENAPLGVKSAVDAGMTVIGITTTVSEEILKEAHYVVGDFYDVEKLILKLTGIKE